MNFEPIHSSRATNITWGAISLQGALSKDSYIDIAPSSDLTTTSMDAGSFNISISKLADKSALVTIQLQPQSSANIALMRTVQMDDVSGGVTVANIDINTLGTVFMYDLVGCHIQQRPTESKSEDLSGTTNTWVFHCAELRPKELGSTVLQANVQGSIQGEVNAMASISIDAIL